MAITSESEPSINSFRDELRRRRRLAGLSQAALAERAGLSTEAVSLLERGRRVPRPTTIRLLADALDLVDHDRSQLMTALLTRLPPEHELPRYDDLLVGRTAEIEQVATLLTSGPARLLTLTGPGGVGKTRLAVAAANAVAGKFSSGVRWVQALASDDGDQLAAAVRTALGQAPAAALPSAHEPMADEPMLLVIDRAEPFLPALVALVDGLLRRTSSLRVLVTSRERLHLPQEVSLVVTPLRCDPATPGADGESEASPATRLFVARAALSQTSDSPRRGSLSARDAAAVNTICRRVDGVPLAIELAAARTTLLSITELATALDTTLRFLYTPHADDEVALRDVMVGETYPHLSRPEQELLARLSVFCHSFDQTSIAAICAEESTTSDEVDTLSLLVSKSLVLRGSDVDGCASYRLLRVVRDFAEEQLVLDPECLAVRRRHAHYFRDQAVLAAPHLSAGGKTRWARKLDTQSEDLRRAFSWCLRHNSASALVMVDALWRWWHLRGRDREGRSLATAALQCSIKAPAELRAPALAAAGMLALLQCDYEAAQGYVQQGLDLYSAMPDGAGVRWSLGLLGSVALQRGEYTVASQLHEQALVLARRAADPLAVGAQLISLSEVAWLRGDFGHAETKAHAALETLSEQGDQQGVVLALIALGVTARYRGDLARAQAFLSHSLQRSDQIGYREGMAWSLNQLGAVSRIQGDLSAAQVQQVRGLEEHRRLGNRWRVASSLDELAAVAVAQGDSERATSELSAADQIRREIGTPVPNAEQPEREATIVAARSLLGSNFTLLAPAPDPALVRGQREELGQLGDVRA